MRAYFRTGKHSTHPVGLLGGSKELISGNRLVPSPVPRGPGSLIICLSGSALRTLLGVLLAEAFLQTHLTQKRNRAAHPCRLT